MKKGKRAKKGLRLISGVLAAFFMLDMLGGCAMKNKVVNYEIGKAPEHTLTFFGNKYETANVEVIEDIIIGYLGENKDTIILYESLKGADYFEALRKREASGHLDDIFIVDHDTALDFSARESLADLTELAKTVPFFDKIKSQMEAEDGRIYWVPTTVSAFGLYCNLDLLREHGQQIPRTLGEWEAACDYFVEQGITPVIANHDNSLKTLALAQGFYPIYRDGKQNEVLERLSKGEEKLSSYLREGFLLAEEFCKKGYIDAKKTLKTQKTSDDLEEFIQGNAPFMLTGAWAAGRVKGMEPDFAFQVVPYPVLEDGAVLVINLDSRLGVSAKSENQEMAKEFVAYFLQEDNIRRFADNQSSFSPLKGIAYEPPLTEIQDIVSYYQTEVLVIGTDSRLRLQIWENLGDVADGILTGENVEDLLEWLDQQAAGEKTD